MSIHIAVDHTGRPGARVWLLAEDGPPPSSWVRTLAEAGLDLVEARPHPPEASPALDPLDPEDDITEVVFDADTAPPGARVSERSVEVAADGPILLWHPDSFEAALVRLSQLQPPHLRARTVLCAPGEPPSGFGDTVRQQGGLTWWRAPWELWIVQLAREALRRPPGPGLLVPTRALEQLQRDARVRPQSFLVAVAEAAREALHAAATEIILLGDHEADARTLARINDLIEAVPLTLDASRVPPMGLAERAAEWRQVVVIPDMAHATVASGGAWAAAIAVPILSGDGPGGERAVLQVYWRRPFLPTPAELQVLRTLGTAASVNQARVAERERLHQAHIDSLQTLARVPWADPRTHTEAATTEGDIVVQFAHRVLVARSALPGLKTFYARLSTASRAKRHWLQVDGATYGRVPQDRSRGLEQLFLDCLTADGRPVEHAPDTWALGITLRSPSNSHGLGAIVATFSDPLSAEEGAGALRRLAADLEIGLRLLRRSHDNEAMKELARQLSDATDPRETLDRMAGLIQRQLHADGVKVWLLAEARLSARIEPIFRTGRSAEKARSIPVDPERGLADWVVLRDDWLCIEHPSMDAGGPLRPTLCRTGRHGDVQVEPRASGELWDIPTTDSEVVQVLVPLHHRDQVAGVLGVWRSTRHPFESVLDVESLVGFAPHVSSACARAKAMERSDSEFEAISLLARRLTPETSLHDLSLDILASAGRLSGTHCALLLRHDASAPGALAPVGFWAQDDTTRAHRDTFLHGTLDWGTDPADWKAHCRAFLEHRAGDAPPLMLHQFVVLPPDASRHPIGAVALLTAPSRPAPVPILSEAATRESTESFLQYGGLLLANHVRVHAAAVVDQLARTGSETSSPLERAADRLRRTLQEGVVLITVGNGARQVVTATVPASLELDLATIDANAFSRGHDPTSLRIADSGAAAPHTRRLLDEKMVEAVVAASGWSGVRSWMGVPVVHGSRLLGTLQVFTPPRGTALLAEHETIAESLARWAAEETVKAQRRTMLEQLNHITSDLAGVSPNVLAEQLPLRLQAWARNALYRTCQVAVVARSGAHHVLLCASTDGIKEVDRTDLRTLSLAWTGEAHTWQRRSRLPGISESTLPTRFAGAAAALRLASDSPLEGHIVLLHNQAFTPADLEVLDDAAREMAVLLHGEAVRHEWKLQAGLFRHALLGPVQGLQSAAKFLDAVTRLPSPPEARVREARDRIAKETETLRMWRETQKIYTMVQEGGVPDVRLRRQALKPLVTRCMARYEASMRLRNIDLRLDWAPAGGLQFEYDHQMLDLVLSNLLDNACKYAYFHRSVTVEVGVHSDDVVLAVENIGGPIPPDQDDTIYLAGTRARGRDPIRAIAGEGLGLFLSRTLCRAMGGDLDHTCVAVGVVEDDKQPHRVRFTARLPHRWNRK